jgi:uncharacterized phage protein (TIGR02218 family)
VKNASAALKAFIPSTRQRFETDLITIAPATPQNFLAWSQNFDKPVYFTNLLALTPNTQDVPDPIGLFTAYKMVATGGANADGYAIDQQLGCPQTTQLSTARVARMLGQNVVTFSVWLRTLSGSTSALALWIRETDNVSTTTDKSVPIGITSAWQRFFVTRILDDSATTTQLEVFLRGKNPTVGGATWDNSVPNIYAWGAQVEARGTPGPYISTRATPEWGSIGPLPEVIRLTTTDQDVAWQGNAYSSRDAQNLVRWSQDFENWSQLGAVVLTPDAIIAPDGTQTADKFVCSSTGTGVILADQILAVPPVAVAGKQFTWSCWLKALSGAPKINLLLEESFVGGPIVANQAFTLSTAWQKFSVTGIPSQAATAIIPFIYNPDTATEYHAWGGQLEMGDTMRPYFQTFAIPRNGIGLVTRSSLRWGLGMTVDTMELKLDAPTLNSLLASGFLDGARVQLDRLFGNSPASLADSVTLFTGNVADITALGRTSCKLLVRSRLELLNQPTPRNEFQASCRWMLYDDGCKIIKPLQGSPGTVQSGSTALVINTGFTAPAGYGDLGTITFLSGVNAGISATIKRWAQPGGAAVITLNLPLPSVPGVGDRISVYPGCDKLQSTCLNKFANTANFGGFRFVPVPETAL